MGYDWATSRSRSATTDFGRAVPPRAADPESAPSVGGLIVAAAVDEFLAAAEAGRAVNRSGRAYLPSALRDLRSCLEYRVVPHLGDVPLGDVRRADVQALVDRLGADGLSESRIRSVVSALRALYGYAIERGDAEFSPADGLVMPQPGDARGAGDRRDGADAPDPQPPAEMPPPRWSDRFAEVWEDRPAWRLTQRRQEDPAADEWIADGQGATDPERRPRDRADFEPIALLPERLLSFGMRVVFVLFALVVLASLLQSI
jgi:hypothetical protein